MNSKFLIFLFAVMCACALVSGSPISKDIQEDETIVLTRASCVLPMETGICRARMARWGYDASKKDCVAFYYGGCLGNGNNFLTKEECVKFCKGSQSSKD